MKHRLPSAASLSAMIVVLATPVQANAQGVSGIAIPEPSNLALFGIGLAGLVIGRHVAKRRADSED